MAGGFGCAGLQVRLDPSQQIPSTVSDGASGDLHEARATSTHTPILKSADGVAEKVGRFLFVEKPVEKVWIGREIVVVHRVTSELLARGDDLPATDMKKLLKTGLE